MSARPPRRYRALPVTVEAERWTGILTDLPDTWLEKDWVSHANGVALVRTRNGLAEANVGDYIVKEYDDDLLYPVRRHIFQAKYTPAGSDE